MSDQLPDFDVPNDVRVWLDDTLDADEAMIWLMFWSQGDEAKRTQMLAEARADHDG